MFYNDFFGCVLRWAFCKYRSLLSELCKDPLEVPGEEGHFSGSPGGSELPLQELQGAGEGQVGVGMALLCLGRRIRVVPSGPVAKALCSKCREPTFNPWSGN